jgi:hypothetical protein
MKLCTHHECRCARAAELAAQGRTMEAIDAHYRKVRCRRSPGDEENGTKRNHKTLGRQTT